MNIDYKVLSKVFNSNVLAKIAINDFCFLKNISQQYSDLLLPNTLTGIYEKIYEILLDKYRNEYIFKNLIFEKLLLEKHTLDTATMLSEFRVGTNKADCVILNGKSVCYEVKTDFDTLIRLPEQLNSYSQVFDEVYVVSTLKHLKNVERICPDNIGIMILDEHLNFEFVKDAIQRKTQINLKLYMQSLRREEYLSIAEYLVEDKLIAPNTQIYDKCLNIIEEAVSKNIDINKIIIETLKKYRRNDESFMTGIPSYLWNASVSYKFSKPQVENLIHNFTNGEMINVLSDF
jgi:hypothetical protein